MPRHKEHDLHDLLVDEETWLAFFESAFCQDSSAAQYLAHLLFTLKESINSGPEGVKRGSDTLIAGIRLIYLYTDAHKAALKLYMLSLTGHLKPQDEPLILTNKAIERGLTEIERAIAGKGKTKKQS